MKPKWVATLNAGKFKAGFQIVKNFGTVLLISLLMLFISCDNSDDLETVGNEPPPNNELPPDNELPPNESPPNESPPNNNESLIVYTDIVPDFTSQNLKDSYNLDLNNDKIIDFTVSSFSDTGYEWLKIDSNSNAANGILSVAPWYTHPVPLNSGIEIFNLVGYTNGEFYGSWGIFVDCFTGEQECYFYWKDEVEKYLGLRIIINGKTHYGWARMNVTSVTLWEIKDYAYNATPNKPILAGQKN